MATEAAAKIRSAFQLQVNLERHRILENSSLDYMRSVVGRWRSIPVGSRFPMTLSDREAKPIRDRHAGAAILPRLCGHC